MPRVKSKNGWMYSQAVNPRPAARQGRTEPRLLASPLDETKGLLERALSRIGNLRRLLEQADVPLDPSKFILLSAGLAAIGAAVCIIVPQIPNFCAPIVAPILGVLPLLWIVVWRKRSDSKSSEPRCPKRWN